MKPSKLITYTASVLVIAGPLASLLVRADTTYVVQCGKDRLEFVPQAEKGYVIKLAEKAGGITALSGVSIPDGDSPRPVKGLDRHGVWTVENKGPAGRNEDAIRSLRTGGQMGYGAPLFSSNGETVAIIPEIVVRVKPGTEMEQLKALCEKTGCTIKKRMEFTQQEYLLLPDRRSNCHDKRDNFKKWDSCTVCCLWAEGEGVR